MPIPPAAKKPQRLVAKSGPSRAEALIKAPLLVPFMLLGLALSRADRNDLHGARLSGTKHVAWTRPVGLELVRALGLIIPPALFFSILWVLGRMYRDSEMVALAASGVGYARLFRSVLIAAVPLAALEQTS